MEEHQGTTTNNKEQQNNERKQQLEEEEKLQQKNFQGSDRDENNLIKKRHRVILFGYVGTNYRGLQIQGIKENDPITIEKVLFETLVKINGIASWNADDISKLSWQRSSRTDAGVSAAAQIINLQLK